VKNGATRRATSCTIFHKRDRFIRFEKPRLRRRVRPERSPDAREQQPLLTRSVDRESCSIVRETQERGGPEIEDARLRFAQCGVAADLQADPLPQRLDRLERFEGGVFYTGWVNALVMLTSDSITWLYPQKTSASNAPITPACFVATFAAPLRIRIQDLHSSTSDEAIHPRAMRRADPQRAEAGARLRGMTLGPDALEFDTPPSRRRDVYIG